jgi:hypothetical protein
VLPRAQVAPPPASAPRVAVAPRPASSPTPRSAPAGGGSPYVGGALSAAEIRSLMSHAGSGCPHGPCKGCPHHDVQSGACTA